MKNTIFPKINIVFFFTLLNLIFKWINLKSQRASGADVTVSEDPAHSVRGSQHLVKHTPPLRVQSDYASRFPIEDKTMPLFEGLGSGGEKTAVVIDLGAAYTK